MQDKAILLFLTLFLVPSFSMAKTILQQSQPTKPRQALLIPQSQENKAKTGTFNPHPTNTPNKAKTKPRQALLIPILQIPREKKPRDKSQDTRIVMAFKRKNIAPHVEGEQLGLSLRK